MSISPMRRATVNVPRGKLDEVKRFYEEVLGMKVFYEGRFDSKTGENGEAKLLGIKGEAVNRMVSLSQGEATFGMVGLLEFEQPVFDVRPFRKQPGLPYPVIFVFNVENIEEIHARAVRWGSQINIAPHEWEVPGRGMAKGMHLLDPLGIDLDLNEFAGGPSSAPAKASALRRVTLAVPRGQMDRARGFYERVLGMRAFYDSEIAGKGANSGLGVGDYRVHLVSMQQGGSTDGMVGLMEYLEPEMEVRPLARSEQGLFPVSFVFLVDDLDSVYARARQEGAEIVTSPLSYDIPGRGFSRGTTFLDPCGALIGLTEFPK